MVDIRESKMTSYRCMQMFISGDHIIIISTDVASFQEIGEKAKELVASVRWQAGDPELDGPYRLTITHLKNSVRKAHWGLLQFLCGDGWEPFSAQNLERDKYQRLWLRKREEE